ncbi:hypothetical protein HY492_00200 [Candidatus Woesearchaeota archaeon]|nr:hypothetical protein [Candidatus Woesearchaeota archaeon]
MDKTDYLLIGVLVLVLGALAFALIAWFVPGANPATAPSSSSGFAAIDSGTTDTGDVSIALTPLGVKDGLLQVSIAANTHSVDLAPFDLAQMTTLTADGQDYQPVSAPSLSGHHTSGTLAFALETMPKSFTITIVGIPAVETRTFAW